jgi:hypothetical protein
MQWARHFVLIFFFLVIIFGVPITQAILEISDDESPQILELFSEAPTEEHLRQFEKDLEEYSFFEENIRPVYQLARYFVRRGLGHKAVLGKDGWYFYHPGLKYLTEPYYKDRAALMPEGTRTSSLRRSSPASRSTPTPGGSSKSCARPTSK